MRPDLRLRPYRPDADLAAVAYLWHAALAPTWPVLPRALARLRAGLLAEKPGAAGSADARTDARQPGTGGSAGTTTVVGFVAVDPAGSVPLLLVRPDHQRAGCGTALLEAALARLRHEGATTVTIGSGGADYIWPGAPLDAPAGVAFFTRAGFTSWHDTRDLTQDLTGYRPPAGAYPDGMALDVAGPADLPAARAFEEATFPQWARWFDGTAGDILLARDPAGTIVGSLLHSATDPGPYAPLLGPRAGSIGCVGVVPDRHGQGIGTALVARASERLRDAGTRTCLIDWVVRDAFYGRNGYRPWRAYRMFSRPL